MLQELPFASPIDLSERVETSAQAVRSRFGFGKQETLAKVGVVLGSGLGHFAQQLEQSSTTQQVCYKDVPYFSTAQVQGHKGQLLFSHIQKHPILFLQGRVHCYEGHPAWQTALPIRTLYALGVRHFVLTGAAGAIGNHLQVGDLMLITDHINLTGKNPLAGYNNTEMGSRFVDMTDCYSPLLRNIAHQLAFQQGLELKEGIYAGLLGPTYETPAEVRMLQILGADAVAMSVVAETITVRHMGGNVLGIACMTNKAAGLSSNQLNHEDVQRVADRNAKQFSKFMNLLLPRLALVE